MVKHTQTIRRQFAHFVGLALKGLIFIIADLVQWVIHASYLKSNLIIWECFNGGCEQLQKFVSKYCLNATVVPKNVCTLLTSALGNGRGNLSVLPF